MIMQCCVVKSNEWTLRCLIKTFSKLTMVIAFKIGKPVEKIIEFKCKFTVGLYGLSAHTGILYTFYILLYRLLTLVMTITEITSKKIPNK